MNMWFYGLHSSLLALHLILILVIGQNDRYFNKVLIVLDPEWEALYMYQNILLKITQSNVVSMSYTVCIACSCISDCT